MDKQARKQRKVTPDYKSIYSDILKNEFPEKIEECQSLLNKKHLSVLDVQKLNQKVFGVSDQNSKAENGKYHSYKKSDILHMLDYQRKHNLNNSQLARHFKLSNNSVSKWKRMFLI
ncbi:helix-turn-helix domain-containing protein [Chryseobacterium sp. c4a]|uniref:helix-turn-helix domain-containing protein n=1 Tax=Chryseobacterium sp. c4a TaxID=1573582 RepID=UPI00135BC0B7|nr:helix-turn-helix domain-containing protein [Chryseobacterium sp. c4a]